VFDAALRQAAADFADAAGRLSGSGPADFDHEDAIEQTMRMSLPDGIGIEDAPPHHVLEIVAPAAAAERIPLWPGTILIGRVPPADILLRDAAVSRAHCRIELAADEVRVTDLRSTNGTFVDGERIEETRDLRDGAELRVGGYTLVYRHEEVA
jgi:hypothetical protein